MSDKPQLPDEVLLKTHNIIKISDLTTKSINLRKSPFEQITVPESEATKRLDEGWEPIPCKLKKSIKLKKEKPHDSAFEDRVWGLLAKMGFNYVNGEARCTLSYGEGLTKQIHVIACDHEAVIIVECKSSSERSKVVPQKSIYELAAIKELLRASIRKLIPGSPKVAFIYATNNTILGADDKQCLADNSIHHFAQDHISYYEQLVEHLGAAAKYQLFGTLFEGETIPNLKTRVPAIKGKVASGQTFYSFSIDPHTLLKLSYVLHRNDVDQDSTKAYQRLVKKNRLDQIAKFIDKGGYFPNSIIINIQSDRPLQFDQAKHIEHDASTSFGVLHLPKIYKSAFIIDGQHRLLGYAKTTNDSNHTIPVVAFINLPEEEQTQDFVDINHTQKSVPTNLLHSIMADFHWGSNNDKLAIGALKTRLFTQMNADENSPFYHRIVLAEEGKTQDRSLTLQTVKSWGLGGNVKFFGKFKNDKLSTPGYLTCETHQKTLDKALEFFNATFEVIANQAPKQWSAGSGDGGFIAMNIGVSATMRVVDSILEHLVLEGMNSNDLSGVELANKVAPYLSPITTFVNELDVDGLKKLRSLFGSGATEKVLREFQYAIYKQFNEFNPEGLDQWIKDSSGQYNDKSHHLGHHKIEPFLHKFICDALKKKFGEQNWWAQGVPKKIQKDCSLIRIDQDSVEPDWRYLTTVNYSEIIKANWELLGDALTEPGMHNSGKDKRLGWLVKFNAIRQKYSHPQRESVTESEYKYLEELWGWLEPA